MTAGNSLFFPDNTVLINFHIIDRWDVLEAVVQGRGQWCASVASECSKSTTKCYQGMYPQAHAVFGNPVEPEPVERINAGILRTNMADPTDDHATKHLGEAETITIVDARFSGSHFITDDYAASQFARTSGIQSLGTGDVLVVAERHLNLITTVQRRAYEAQLAAEPRTIRYFKTTK